MVDGPQRAGVYCRLSYAEDGTEEKVDRQEADCRELGARLGWPISEAHIFKDNNRSAWRRNRKRPGWDSLLTAIEQGDIDAVIVWHGDRLIRQPYDLEQLINTADSRGVHLASIAGTRNLDNPDDRYILRIEAAGFCRASDDTSRRVKRGFKKLREQRRPRPGGRRPFGFERDNVTIRAEEAEVIREIAERLLAGQSLSGVVRWLNNDKAMLTPSGNRWSYHTLRVMLRSPRLAGLLVHKGEIQGEAVWHPIIPLEVWLDVKRILEEIATRNPRSENKTKYLLSGIAVCGACGGPLRVHTAHRGELRQYACKNDDCKQRVFRRVELMDAYIEGRVLRLLNDPDFVEALHRYEEDPRLGQQITEMARKKKAATKQLENLADFPEVQVESLMKGIASYERKLVELRAHRATTTRKRLLMRMAGVTREQWQAEPIDVRRRTVEAMLRIEVFRTPAQGRGFNPDTVKVTVVEES